MSKQSKKFLLWTLIICFAIATATLTACDDNGRTNYTVTVTCDDASALTDAKVQLLNENGSVAAESKLTDGKAIFSLKASNYTAIVVGLPSNYAAESQSLSAKVTSCTIAVNITYTVSVTYPELRDVYGNIVHREGEAAQGVTVALYEGKLADDRGTALEGKTPADTKTTGPNGKATFQLDGDIYTIVLSDYTPGLEINYSAGSWVNTVGKDTPNVDVTFKTPRFIPGSSDKAPLELTLGENVIPVTADILAGLDLGAVVYRFTPQRTGNYTFAVSGCGRVSEEEGRFSVIGDKEETVLLQADTDYILWLGVSKTPVSTYTVTVTEGGELGGDDDMNEFENFVGSHSVKIDGSNNNAVAAWYKYTATENASYILSDSTKTLWCIICPGEQNKDAVGHVDFNGDDMIDGTMKFTLTAGTTYYFWICTWDEKPGTVTFTIKTDDTMTL